MNGAVDEASLESWPKPAAAMLRAWRRNQGWITNAAVVLMGLVAVAWLGYQAWRLTLQGGEKGAIDLGQRYREVALWFDREPLYRLTGTAVYPPASYAMMWPFLGWLEKAAARWLWFATTIPVLYWFTRALLRESLVEQARLRAVVVLIPLSFYATGATIGNGQLTLHVVAATLAALLLILRAPVSAGRDALGAALIIFGLIKVTVAAPFFWIVLFLPKRLRPAIFVLLGYAALTLIAAAFQEASIAQLFEDWLHRAQEGTKWGASRGSTSNVHTWLSEAKEGAAAGGDGESWLSLYSLSSMHRSVTAGMLGLLGLLIFCHRRADAWLLVGITGVVARFWVYHMWYDDLLILFPVIALLRICKLHASDWKCSVPAAIMLGCSLPTMLAPGGLYTLPGQWKVLYELFQTALWILMGIFLYAQIWRGKRLDINPPAV